LEVEVNDKEWLSDLDEYNCPCSTECIDREKWDKLTDNLHGYHVGAKVCMRSVPQNGHANQCCYDSDGKNLRQKAARSKMMGRPDAARRIVDDCYRLILKLQV